MERLVCWKTVEDQVRSACHSTVRVVGRSVTLGQRAPAHQFAPQLAGGIASPPDLLLRQIGDRPNLPRFRFGSTMARDRCG
jgi:hypothetical protein